MPLSLRRRRPDGRREREKEREKERGRERETKKFLQRGFRRFHNEEGTVTVVAVAGGGDQSEVWQRGD